MVTFTINIPQMLAYIPYMDPVGSIPSIPLRQRGGPWPQLQFLLSAAGSLSGARPGRGISRYGVCPGVATGPSVMENAFSALHFATQSGLEDDKKMEKKVGFHWLIITLTEKHMEMYRNCS